GRCRHPGLINSNEVGRRFYRPQVGWKRSVVCRYSHCHRRRRDLEEALHRQPCQRIHFDEDEITYRTLRHPRKTASFTGFVAPRATRWTFKGQKTPRSLARLDGS
ncbi:hypothetical protein CSUI_000301, partial [Cystoisospora suis]